MSVGDVYISDGIEFEVIWDGGEGLIGGRDTKPSGFWTPPKRLYNKKSEYWAKKDRAKLEELDGEVVLRADRTDGGVEHSG